MNTSIKPSRVIRDERGVTYVHSEGYPFGKKVVYWYNRDVQHWVVQTLDSDDCQLGNSDYVRHKHQAINAAQRRSA